MQELQIITSNQTIPEIVNGARELFLSGDIDQLLAFVNITKYAKAIDEIKKDPSIKEAIITEISKYGKQAELHGCVIESKESGVRYDFSECGDDELLKLYAERAELDGKIKEREAVLKGIRPTTALLEEDTGQMFKAPLKTSTTTVQVTFKKK